MPELADHLYHQHRLAYVQNQIFCPQSGKALDVRTAVFVVNYQPDGFRSLVGGMHPSAFEEWCTNGRAAALLSAYPTAHFVKDDGTDLTDKVDTSTLTRQEA